MEYLILNSSPITDAIILVSATAPFWYTFLTLKRSGHTTIKSFNYSFAYILWGVLMFGIVRFGWLDSFPGGRPILSWITLFIPLFFTILFRKKIFSKDLSQKWLIGLQVFRVIGVVFLIEMVRANIPGIFAHPAGWGDILTGIVAASILIYGIGKKSLPIKGILLVTAIGILDFISAFSFGFLSSEGPWQLLSFEQPNAVYQYPTGLIPMYLVPFASVFHFLTLYQLLIDYRRSKNHNVQIIKSNPIS